MTITTLRKICKTLPGVTEDIKWEDHLCFNVGQKMFLVTSPDKVPHTASFKVLEDEFDNLCEREGFMPAPYLARYKWVFIDDINHLNKKEWEQFIRQSYNLIFSKLPAKVRKEITLD